jgi:trk system potassium uptake protein TrkA
VRSTPGFPRECVFIGVVDPQGRATLPEGSTLLRAGHTVIMVSRRSQLAAAVEFLSAEPVAGAGTGSVLAATLRKVDFLAPLSDEELEAVARGAELVQRPAGTELFRQGEPGQTFYVVLSGEVQVKDSAAQLVATVKPGGFFGELALLTGEPRTATAVTATACELAAVGREDFRGVVMANPSVALEMSRILGERLSRVQGGKPQPKRWALFGR